MPKAVRRFLTVLLTLATALVALLMFLLGIGRSDWGGSCTHDDDCKPALVCGTPLGVPYCTQRCAPDGPDTCAAGFACARDGVCHKR